MKIRRRLGGKVKNLAILLVGSAIIGLTTPVFADNTLEIITREAKRVAEETDYVSVAEGEKEDYWQTPEETIKSGKGNCADHSILLDYFLSNKYGIETDFCVGIKDTKNVKKDSDGKRIRHTWLEYTIQGGEKYIIETTTGEIYKRSEMDLEGRYKVQTRESEGAPFFQKLATKIGSLHDRAGREIFPQTGRVKFIPLKPKYSSRRYNQD